MHAFYFLLLIVCFTFYIRADTLQSEGMCTHTECKMSCSIGRKYIYYRFPLTSEIEDEFEFEFSHVGPSSQIKCFYGHCCMVDQKEDRIYVNFEVIAKKFEIRQDWTKINENPQMILTPYTFKISAFQTSGLPKISLSPAMAFLSLLAAMHWI
ncbi:hypothetical protein HMI54_000313 [Coelomomyces lativittatus]|nr:hypothetical protein HMI55_007297 [Coelomomyces lativittatus]KAJ1512051.1 hypothetical protein HMI54_000313 [Coelomomyces lativittatus]KAJ1514004.1 hypothetical protein HMI56_001347 [Coelomomyces lativittatus]